MSGVEGEELLRLPVRLRGIQLGRVVDVLFHPTESRALGVDVLCGDERHRFLPFPAARLGSGELEVASPLVLLDLREGSFYRRQARPLTELRGTTVGDGRLHDVVLDPSWAVAELVLEGDGKPRRVPLDGLTLPPRAERSGRRSR